VDWIEAGIILSLIVVNGLFSASELALVSARKARLHARADTGHRGARAALELLNNPTQLLSTVQVGITLVGILTGVYGGGVFAEELEEPLAQIQWLAPYAEEASLSIVVAAITYLTLILGELVPKRFALAHAETIAEYVALPMAWMARAARPIVWLLQVSTDAAAKVLPMDRAETSVTDDDIRGLVTEAERLGTLERREKVMIDGVLRLADRSVESIMVPRGDVVWLDVDAPLEESWQEARNSGHSRFPICRGDLEQMIGVITLGDLGEALRLGRLDLEAHVHEALHIPRSATVLSLPELLRSSKVRLAIVTGEYGDIRGIVTAGDLLRAIAGEIGDVDGDAPRAIQRADGSWLLDGQLSVHDAARVLGRDDLAQGEDYHTVAGFVLWQLGHLPEVGETFTWRDLKVEVIDRDGKRIDQVLVSSEREMA
jgi:putative hemolysin